MIMVIIDHHCDYVNIDILVYDFCLQLFMIDNAADDWRIAMTWQRMMQV